MEGTGSATPAGVKLPGAYSATDPGILINIYQQLDDYIIPGPEVYKAGGSGGSSPAPPVAVPTTTRPVPTVTSTAAPIATLTPPSASAPAPAPTTLPEAPLPGPEDDEHCEEL